MRSILILAAVLLLSGCAAKVDPPDKANWKEFWNDTANRGHHDG